MSVQTPSWVVLGLGLWVGPFVFCMFLMNTGNFLVYYRSFSFGYWTSVQKLCTGVESLVVEIVYLLVGLFVEQCVCQPEL